MSSDWGSETWPGIFPRPRQGRIQKPTGLRMIPPDADLDFGGRELKNRRRKGLAAAPGGPETLLSATRLFQDRNGLPGG